MQKTFSPLEIRNAVIEIQDAIPLLTPSQRYETLLTPSICDENQQLAVGAKALIQRGQVPKHAVKQVFRQIAEKRNYFYFDVDKTRGIFLHISRFDEVLKKIRNYLPTPQ